MTEKEVIQKLKDETAKNPPLSALLTVFAARPRSRRNVELRALANRMTAEGFKYQEAEYARCLEFLATLGLGSLIKSPQGKPRALAGLRYTLQSIGTSALGGQQALKTIRYRNRYAVLGGKIKPPAPETSLPPATAPAPKMHTKTKLVLTFVLTSGKAINVTIPPDFTKAELAEVVSALGGMSQ